MRRQYETMEEFAQAADCHLSWTDRDDHRMHALDGPMLLDMLDGRVVEIQANQKHMTYFFRDEHGNEAEIAKSRLFNPSDEWDETAWEIVRRSRPTSGIFNGRIVRINLR